MLEKLPKLAKLPKLDKIPTLEKTRMMKRTPMLEKNTSRPLPIPIVWSRGIFTRVRASTLRTTVLTELLLLLGGILEF